MLDCLTNWLADWLPGRLNECQTAWPTEWRVEQCGFDLPALKSVSEIKSILIRHSNQLDSSRLNSSLGLRVMCEVCGKWQLIKNKAKAAAGSQNFKTNLWTFYEYPNVHWHQLKWMQWNCVDPKLVLITSSNSSSHIICPGILMFNLEMFFFFRHGPSNVRVLALVGPISFNKKYFNKL